MRRAQELGDESALPWLLFLLGDVERLLGNLDTALDRAREGRAAAEQAGQRLFARHNLALEGLVHAQLGRPDQARQATRSALENTRDNYVRGVAAEALGQLELALGAPEDAVVQLEPRVAFARAQGIAEPGATRFTVDLIEALVELGRRDEALEILGWYEGNARRLERASALANCRRCRGLLAAQAGELGAALADFEDALAWHDRARIPLDNGRTLLALGVAQRRAKRRREARATLEQALALFERIGAALWAERARGELRRISGRAATTGALTPAEERVAALVAGGRRIARSRPRCSSPIGRSRGTSRASSGSSASSTAPSWLERSNPANHRGSQVQTRVIRPFRPSRALHSLETGGQKVTWRQGDGAMTPKISFITAIVGAALVLAVPAFGDSWGADQNQATVRVSPDLVDRAAAARQQELSSMLDARERSFAAKSEATRIVSPDPVRDDRFRLDPASIPTPAATILRPTEPSGCRSGWDSVAASCSWSASSGGADDATPPARPLIDSHLALDAVRAETPTAEATRRPVDPPAGVLH